MIDNEDGDIITIRTTEELHLALLAQCKDTKFRIVILKETVSMMSMYIYIIIYHNLV